MRQRFEPSSGSRLDASPHWLAAFGFEPVHTPGVSRALRRETADGYLLVTDVGGYDFPDPGAPASAYAFNHADESLDFVEDLPDSRSLLAWVARALRQSRMRATGSPRGVKLREVGGGSSL